MKCPKCGKLWSDVDIMASSTYWCPFCGESYDDAIYKKEHIGKILIDIVDR